MTETITTQPQAENDSWGNQYPEDLWNKIQENRHVQGNAVEIAKVFTQEEMRAIEAADYPDRIEDPEEARAMAEATDGQETGMVRSRARIDAANEQMKALERQVDSRKTALGRAAARIATRRQMREIEENIVDVNNDEYWEGIKAQRDKRADEAQAAYRAENNPQ